MKAALGPFPPAGGGVLTPGQLNTVFPYSQKWITADEMTIGKDATASTFKVFLDWFGVQRLTAIEFRKAADGTVWYQWGVKGAHIDWSDPRFTFKLIWLQMDVTPAPAPTDFVYFETGIGNVLLGGSLDQDLSVNQHFQSPVLDRRLIQSGDTTSDENGNRSPVTVADPLSASDTNFLMINIGRDSTDLLDTFGQEAFLLGAMIQYKNDFNNIAEFPI